LWKTPSINQFTLAVPINNKIMTEILGLYQNKMIEVSEKSIHGFCLSKKKSKAYALI